jgi:hypothetical protein
MPCRPFLFLAPRCSLVFVLVLVLVLVFPVSGAGQTWKRPHPSVLELDWLAGRQVCATSSRKLLPGSYL